MSVQKRYMDTHRKCVNEWKGLLLSEKYKPITDKYRAATTAVLLNNQYQECQKMINEAAIGSGILGGNAAYGGSVGQGDRYAAGDNRLPRTVLPMVRRAAPEMLANEITGVQPMTAPIGLIFAMRFRYKPGPLEEAQRASQIAPWPTNVADASANGGYGVGTHRTGVDNPPGDTDMTQQEATVGKTITNADGSKTVVPGKEMNFNYLDNTFTGRKNEAFRRVINQTTGLPYTDAEVLFYANSKLETATALATFAALKTAAALDTSELTGDAKTTAEAQKAAAVAALTATSLAGGRFVLSDQDLGTAALTGDYEATGRIGTFQMTFEKEATEAGTRRLGSSWTLEVEQDLRSMNGIDIETEVLNTMSYELQAQIDRELVIRMIYAALSHNEVSYWDARNADARWMAERNRVFFQRLIQASNRMALRNRRGPANFIIATPDVCTLLETLDQFTVMQVAASINTSNGATAKVGTIDAGRFTVYRDTRTSVQNADYMNQPGFEYTVDGDTRTSAIPDYALLGYKGSEPWDAGIIYCPYIPIMLQKVVDPVSFEPKVGLMTRYGVVDHIFGSHLYYHMIIMDTLSLQKPVDPLHGANTFPTPWDSNAAVERGGIQIYDNTPTA